MRHQRLHKTWLTCTLRDGATAAGCHGREGRRGQGGGGPEEDFHRKDRTAGLRTDSRLPAEVQNEGPAPASRRDDTWLLARGVRDPGAVWHRTQATVSVRGTPSASPAQVSLRRGTRRGALRGASRRADPAQAGRSLPHRSAPSPPGRHGRLLAPVSSVPTQSTSPPASSRRLSVTDSSRRHLIS